MLTRLTSGAGWDLQPAWSPDGKRIAFINSPNFGGGTLQVIDAGSGKALRFAPSVRAQGLLWFHPDGTRVLSIFRVGEIDRLAWCRLPGGEFTPIDGLSGAHFFAVANTWSSAAWRSRRRKVRGLAAGSSTGWPVFCMMAIIASGRFLPSAFQS